MKLSFVVTFTIPMEFHLNIINRKYPSDEKKIKIILLAVSILFMRYYALYCIFGCDN